MIATRESYGKALVELGEKYKDIVVLDADLSEATKTCDFAKKYPDRFFDMGISEQDMIGTAAGFATCNKTTILSTFAVFATGRAYDQIRCSVCYPNLNVKIVATHAGITVGEDGATHQALEDINLMRGLPNMKIICPCDDVSTRWAIEEAININGPVYVRLTRPKVDNIYNQNEIFEFGKGKVIGDGIDVALISNGMTLHECIKAKQMLEERNLSVRVIDIHTIKPIDKDLIIDTAKQVKNIFTVDDHNIIGGIGTAVCEVLSEFYPKKVTRIGINDCFGKSGKWNELLEDFNIDANGILSSVLNNI